MSFLWFLIGFGVGAFVATMLSMWLMFPREVRRK